MTRRLEIRQEVFALTRPFRIARGSRTEAEVVSVNITEGDIVGRGECTPYPRYGESIGSTIAAIEGCRALIEAMGDRKALSCVLPAGAARNAIDCALWDLEAKLAHKSVAALIGREPVRRTETAITVCIDTPSAMAAEAAKLAALPLLKVKVDGDDPMARIAAVRSAAPRPRLIVDPNESWSIEQLVALQPDLAAAGVDLLEQPIPAQDSAALTGLERLIPICADEAAHTSADIPGLLGRYDYVNLKLDKTGGLTEALHMAKLAREAGLGLMIGCMLGSSLAIAPAALLAGQASFADLDGPYLFAADYDDGFIFDGGHLLARNSEFWGQ